MLNLPEKTEVNKRIPKQKFYENLGVTAGLKRVFVEQIRAVAWAHKLAPATCNLRPGQRVAEIELFVVQLAADALDESALRQMDKGIPYHIVFLLEHDGLYQAWTAYKEVTPTGAVSVGPYYHTPWLAEQDLPMHLDGFSLDDAYDSLVRQIAGDAITGKADSLKEAIAQTQQQEKLQKEIARLEKLAAKEKQPKKRFELYQQIKDKESLLQKE